MLKKVLQSIGLTKGESEVYEALLKLGNTTTGALISKSGISRSKVYEVLERLEQKGLVTEMIKHNTRYFEATSPHRIITYIHAQIDDLEQKEITAKNLVPELIQLQKINLEKQEAKVYTGLEGWKTLYMEILNTLTSRDEYLAFGIGIAELGNAKVAQFFRSFHLKRDEKKIPARILTSRKTKKKMEEMALDLKHYRYRFSETKFPTNTAIYGDNVVTLVWSETPVAFLIHSKQVADKYRKYFQEEWKQAKH